MRAKRATKRYLALMLAALVAVPLSLSGLWVKSQKAEASAPEIDYAISMSGLMYVQHATERLLSAQDETVEMWVYFDPLDTDSFISLFSEGDTSVKKVWSLEKQGSDWFVSYAHNTDASFTVTNVKFPTDQWAHLAVSFSTTTIKFFLNGYESHSVDRANVATTGGTFKVGRAHTASGYFKGKIDQVKIWNGNLTPAQLALSMHSWAKPTDPTFGAPTLRHHWGFNDGTGTTISNSQDATKPLVFAGSPTFAHVNSESFLNGKKVLTFPRSYLTSTGGWTVPSGMSRAELLVVAGGGSGGNSYDGPGAGGGGAGGWLEPALSLTPGSTHAIQIGQGGVADRTEASNPQNQGRDGQPSIFGTEVVAVGGGGGGGRGTEGRLGGSGGGAGGRSPQANTGGTVAGGAGTDGQGNSGGSVTDPTERFRGGAGGGGAASAGSGPTGDLSRTGGLGGAARTSTIFGLTHSAGGKGGDAVAGGVIEDGQLGAANSGSGGGGASLAVFTPGAAYGGNGGSGVVAIAYASTEDRVVDFPTSGTPVTLGSSGQAIPANTSFTFESWVRSTNNSGINNIFSQRVGPNLGEFSFQTIDNQVVVWFRTNSEVRVDTGYNLPTNEWVHLAVTVTRGAQSTLSLYVNGVLRHTSAPLTNVDVSSGFNIGRIYPAHGGGEYFRGQLDQIKIWNGALSAEEITASMHAHNTVTVSEGKSLRAHWDFNDSNAPGQDLVGAFPLTTSSTPVLTSLVSPAQASGKVVYEFKRTYLTAWGGWIPPTGVSPNVDILAVAGGGGGGARHGGGGGAGAIVNGNNIPLAQALTASGVLPIKVGQGGLGSAGFNNTSPCPVPMATSGQSTTLGNLVLAGGGRGQTYCDDGGFAASGGSSGGTSATNQVVPEASAPSSAYGLTSLGSKGGLGYSGGAGEWAAGGGGGANGAGTAASSNSNAGKGGAGLVSSISGTAICFAAGGGGGVGNNGGNAGAAGNCASGLTTAGVGSKGNNPSTSAAPNSGSGGGGSGYNTGGTSPSGASGAGGSGVVILAITSLARNDLAWQKTSLAQNYASANAQVVPATGPWTVEMWIKPDSDILNSGKFHALFSQMADTTAISQRASLWLRDGNLHFNNGGGDETGNFVTYTGYTMTESRWFHVAVSSNNTAVKLFVDGVEILSTTLTKGTIGPVFTLGGARQDSANALEFAGHMDQVKVWNGALEASQLAASMHSYSTAGVESAPTLLAHYDFNEFVSGQVIDRSGNNRHLAFNTGVSGSYSSTNFTDSAIVTTTTTATNQIHQFNRSYLTAAGGWFPPADAPASHTKLIVGAGGGGGAGGAIEGGGGGGGGAGGRVVVLPSLTAITGPQTIRVGAGGVNGLAAGRTATSGQSSSFGTAQAFGGGAGTSAPGSGTVGAAGLAPTSLAAATGGTAGDSSIRRGGGGGGSAGNGIAGSAASGAGNGGPAVVSLLSGSSLSYGGGGGGGVPTGTGKTTADDSAGIGGYEEGGPVRTGANGKPNRGGGGGGGSDIAGGGGQGGTGVVIVSFNLASSAPLPTSAICDGSSTQNTLKVEAGHGEVFYIDTGQGQNIDAAYIAYKVSSPTARSDLWVEVTGFTGGSVSLANINDSALPLGAVAGNGSRTAFFMVKARNATTTAQSHVVNVYDTKPTIGSPRPIYTCNYTFTAVEETIKAAANKVNSVTTSSVAQLGATMTITVDGDTGTIGQGNRIDGRMIWLTPAARSNWPTGALRLESTTLTLFSNSQRTNVLSTHSDTLRVNATTSPALSSTNRQYYRAVYTFRVIGPAAATAPIIPIAMISSGTQIKHTDVSGINGGTVDITQPVVNLTVTKNVSPTTIINDDGTTTFNYTVSLVNGGNQTLVIDEVIDTPDLSLKYKAGSAKFNGASIPDPGLIGTNQLGFSGPMSLPASSTRTITYQMVGTTCAVGSTYKYTNTATARSGTVVIGSGSATQSVVDIRGNCGEAQAVVEVKDEPIPPTATTSGATNVATTTATINGVIDPNGEAGLPVRFEFGTSPTLASDTDFPLAPSTASSTGYGVSANLTGLTPGTTYYYRVVILDKTGNPVLGEIMSFTTDPAPAPPTAQTDQVTAITTSTATFNGSIDPNLVSGGAKASYEWGLENVDGTCTAPTSISLSGFLQSETVPANPDASPPTVAQTEDAILTGSEPTPMTFDVTGLTEGAKYCVRIVGHHGANFGTRVEGAWVPFTMTAKLPQVITFNPAIEALPAGGTTTVSAFTDSESGIEIRFESVDPSICTVDPITGAVTAVATSGVCSITATQAGNDGYYPAIPKTISFEISPPVITTPQSQIPGGTYGSLLTNRQLEASGGSGTYTNWTMTSGSLPPGITLNSSGLLSGTPTAAGVYTFTVTTQSNGITSAPVTYTITIAKVPVVITAANVSVVYGSAVPSVAPVSYSGFVASDNAGNVFPGPGPAPLNIAPTCSTDYQVGDNAGTTNRTTFCSGAWSKNYTFTYVDGTVTVTKLALVVKALDAAKQNRIEGADLIVTSDPSFAGKFTVTPALPSGQTLTNAIPGGVSVSRAQAGTATGTFVSWPAGESPNTYAITPTGATSSTNYTITYLPGVFTIQTPKGVPALAAQNSSVPFGSNSTDAFTVTVTNPCSPNTGTTTYQYWDGSGWATLNTTVLPTLVPGTYSIKATYVPSSSSCYGSGVSENIEITYNLTVLKKIATITAGTSQKWVGDPDPSLGWTITGLAAGVPTSAIGNVTVTRATGENPGEYVVQASGASHPHYTFNYVEGKLYIAKILINTNAQGGVLADRNVSLTCAGLKPGATITLKISTPEQVLATATAANDGTCSVATEIPSDLLGNFRLDTESKFPTDTPISNNRLVSLVTDPPVEVTPPAQEPPAQNPPAQNPPGNSGGLPGPGSLNPAPRPTPSPTPTGGNIPSRPNPGSLVTPRPTVPTPTPSPTSTEQNVAKGPTQADPLATPPLATPPRLPGVPTVLPALPGSAGSAPSSQQRPATVDTGSGVRALEEVASDDSGLASSSRQSGVRTVDELANEKLGGFAPGVGVRIEILGAKTGARFVLADLQAIDAVALIRAMEASITTQAADFSRITRVVRGERPLIQRAWEPEVRKGIDEFFAAVGLGAPRALIDLDLTEVENWVSVSAEVETYQPGSTVFLVATSSPIVLATAEVDQFGRAQLAGAMPVEALGTGEHRVRVVGIRSLEGVSVDDQGEIQLSEALLAEIQRFDLGTQSTIALSGLNPEGGYHSAIRVVPLVPVAPWWTLWFILAGLVLALGARYRRYLDTPTRRVIAASGVLASALPAVIIGWVSTVTGVVWVGILLGLVGAALSWFMPEQKQAARRK